mgnify:CR=1 FL=1
MKRIFILTGEPSGDRLAAEVITELKKINPEIEYLSVGGDNLESLGIKSIYNLKDITYIGITKVLLNFINIKKKINITVDKILEFNPDILFSVDSPDFTLRVSEQVKKINPSIKTIHYVAPQVWVWREHRVKKFKKFLDHILLLFNFEKKYFDKENINNTFVGHPLLDKRNYGKIDISSLIPNDKKIISIFPGSRISELNVLLPILLDFIKLMNKKYENMNFVFHSNESHKNLIFNKLKETSLNNVEVISDEIIKNQVLSRSIFAVSKSGTVSLEICSHSVPSVILYKLSSLNFFLIKSLVKIKFVNIINIINNKEIIPELLQSECNAKEIFTTVNYFLNKPEMISEQLKQIKKTINEIKSETPSAYNAAKILSESFVS